MKVLGVGPDETWMVDNLEWEIVAPQRLGIYAIWHDGYGVGARNSPIRPDRIIRRPSEFCSSRASWSASQAVAFQGEVSAMGEASSVRQPFSTMTLFTE
jgi:hypothetical protein